MSELAVPDDDAHPDQATPAHRTWQQSANERRAARAHDARRLDAELWQLAHLRTLADRQLARGLAELWDRKLFEPLGWARATDLAREYLGVDESRARWLAKVGRALLGSPELDEALTTRKITASHVFELRRIAGPTVDQAERLAWIERAAGMTVRALRRAIHQALKERRETGDDRQDSNEQHSEQPPGGAASETDSEREVTVIDLTPGTEAEDRPEGAWVSINAPPRLALLWQDAVELARAVTGSQLTRGQCAEIICAEFLSAFGDDEPTEIARLDEKEHRRHIQEQVRALFNQADRTSRRFTTRGHARRQLEREAPSPDDERWPAIDWQLPDRELPEDCRIGDLRPWALAATLRHLCDLKRDARYRLAAGLERMHAELLWNELRFVSFDEYCEHRLGFGQRTAQRLRRFRDGLDRFPRLRAAHFKDRISYIAADRLLPVLDPATEAIWVEWAEDLTYREIERVTEKADCYALARATPAVFASYLRELVAKGFTRSCDGTAAASPEHASTLTADDVDRNDDGADDAFQGHPATAFTWPEPHALGMQAQPDVKLGTIVTDDPSGIPLGCPLPPETDGGSPRIVGLPDDLELLDPELCLARIRFWAPLDVVDMFYHVIRRCRHIMPDSSRATWSYAEVIIVHFIQSQDTPAAREVIRRHKIIARDRFRCTCAGCTSRDNLHGHHIDHLSLGGSDEPDNLTTVCAGQHLHGIHGSSIVMGGRAPHRLIVKLGIDPATGRALVCYINERRVSEETADRELARWKASLRGTNKKETQS